MPYEINSLKKYCENLSLEKFLQNFKEPFLLIEKRGSCKGGDLSKYSTYNSAVHKDYSFTGHSKKELYSLDESFIFDFQEAKSNIITIGKLRDCSIILNDQTISKTHALFKKTFQISSLFTNKKNKQWTIIDINSDNGTIVDGQFIIPNKPFFLEKQQIAIQFGPIYYCTLFSPKKMYYFMQSFLLEESDYCIPVSS